MPPAFQIAVHQRSGVMSFTPGLLKAAGGSLPRCAGVPGGTFDAAFAYLMVPKPLRKTSGLLVSRTGQLLGKPLTMLARSVPKGAPFAEILRHSGFMLPSAQTKDIVPWIRTFLEHDFEWYFRLMTAAADHEPMDPSFVECPITVVAGGFDVMTSMRDVVAFAERIPHAEVHVLHATHFVPLEFPDEVMAMLEPRETPVEEESAGQPVEEHALPEQASPDP